MIATVESASVGLGLVATRLAEAWRPRPVVDRATWCAAHLRLPSETSVEGGAYDLERHAYVREVLAAVDDPDVESIILPWSVQSGKTSLLMAILASQSILAPVQSIIGGPDKDAMLKLRDKFYRICEVSPVLRPTIPPQHLRNDRWLDVGGLRCHIAYAMNTQTMSGESCALVLATELDRWRERPEQGDPVNLIAARTVAFHQFKRIFESSPTDDSSRILALYEQSDRREFFVPCPKCNHWQVLRMFPHQSGPFAGAGGVMGLKNQKGEWLASDAARERAWYACERGCRLDDSHKPTMVAAGRWVPRGQQIEGSGKLAGEAQRGPRIWGGRLSALYSDAVTFGRLAAEYLDSRDDRGKRQVFQNAWLALRWRQKADVPRWRELGRRLRGSHRRGTVPASAVFLTAGVDVGKSYARWVVRAWGEGGTSWLVDWGTTRAGAGGEGTTSRVEHLEALTAALVEREFPLVDKGPLGVTSLRVRLVAIDSGYTPLAVHNWARKHPGDRVRCVAGVVSLKSGEAYRMQVVERNVRTGKPYPGALHRWAINRDVFNTDLQSRWRAPLDEPGAWWLVDLEPARYETYLRELVNEGPVMKPTQRGRSVRIFSRIDHRVGNHSWDCEVYALAAADMVVGGQWARLVERWRQATPQQRQRTEEEPSRSKAFVRRPSGSFFKR